MAYQGSFWHWDMPLTGLDWRLFNWRQLEFHNRLNFLKAGLVFSDVLSTVSPTYAREIQTPEFGCGFDGLLRARRHDLHGIVNGIDPAAWNPAIDPHLAANYDAETFAVGKAACKAALQRGAGLPGPARRPPLRPDRPARPAEGVGPPDGRRRRPARGRRADGRPRRRPARAITACSKRLAARHPDKLRVFLEFSNPLSHQIEAGADLFLMPSLYEPCGLNQLYSLAYGTIPIVRATGGLADTVVDATPEALANGTATGFAFRDATRRRPARGDRPRPRPLARPRRLGPPDPHRHAGRLELGSGGAGLSGAL